MLFVLGLKNFAVYKSAYQSSTLNHSNFLWTADKAVDGNITGENPNLSKTCSATKFHLNNHTWEVDIGFLIVVKTIMVYKRSDYEDQLSGFNVFIGNATKPWTTNQPLVEAQPNNAPHTFRVNDSLARFVSVIRQNSDILTLCEVIVDGECQKGRFGDVCNETCGNCLNGNLSCNGTTGQCIDGCERGWSGITCKEGCKIGAYGYGCNETCGMCFSSNNSCSAIDGQCMLGCEPGWKGETCKQECNRGAYGHDCNETCGMCFGGNSSCSKFDGHCQFGCEAGWRGAMCKQDCDIGKYGYGCNETCGMCFSGNNTCLRIDGHCKFGCEAGWRGETCKQECIRGAYGHGCNATCGMCFGGNSSCSTFDGHCHFGCEAGWRGAPCKQDCDIGTYGYGCNETCGMCLSGNNSCSTINGHCKVGCEAGWRGETCKQELSVPPTPSDNIIIIGAIVPVVIVIIIVVIILVVLRVRRKRSNLNKEVPSMPNQEKTVFHQVIQEEESSDLPQDIKDTSFSKGSVYQNTAKKTQLMAKSISVLSFWSHVMKKKANKEEFECEFQEFTQGLTKKHEVALANPSKNRYKSMYPYDCNRVILKRLWRHVSEYENNSDYINASHIKGFEGCKCYIAAQGPINKTVDDFWWMVWQEGTECIFMLTNLNEMGKMKCIQYWPDKDDEQTYGDVTVKIIRTESLSDYVRRDFQLIVVNVLS
ncbi:hypothetical protein CHS0354_028697 [Potamilus streckersoni]|uniref:protein-tyrosine-phosphatase n=1 Tax=Potamilus streckersoni TaxID=2493646 RepID=A0AAE0VYW9_9BIVA|nr:hypothetical protein CHS0354_028697 [Potamilus streckersoni]